MNHTPATTPGIVAHRGLSHAHQELSLAAYEAAFALPIDGVECDVRLSADGVPILVHDADFSRLSEGADTRLVRELSAAEAARDHGILTLDEFLSLAVHYPEHRLYIEFKQAGRNEDLALEPAVVKTLQRHGLRNQAAERICFISFSPFSLHRAKQLAPTIPRIYLRPEWFRFANPMDFLPRDYAGLGVSIARAKRRPQLLYRQYLPSYVWTVDEAEDLLWAAENGADFIATNRAELACEVFGLE